ncbi:DEAD/DEAH box helicase [Cohnella hashimotonis]|uniref:DEAD/DEAH box helicase n=1 Tax=Cohnella hashimotonis TaxID=2826895 RepID=A0ABT6TC13_9BACL|nr:DEAD/DEAH box helicase [Cohnella hashimotonis]MDI4644374.1 DEAD/DEAH box helicase [Cohnella hashimotonis]
MSEEQIERQEDMEGASTETQVEDQAVEGNPGESVGENAEGHNAERAEGRTEETTEGRVEGSTEGSAEDTEKRTFSGLGLEAALSGALAAAGILEPTSVQAGVIPELLAGRDGVLRSPTGSGKTLAYLLPLLQRVDPARRETQAVVIAPTQELAMQIVRVSEKFGEPLGVKTVALIGGAALSRQLDRMKGKPAIVVGTPGRIREVASLRKLSLSAVKHVVVDETDRVFSLGGKGDVEFVLKGAARDRQTVFVSATRSDTMRAAEAKWLRDPWETTVRQEQEPGLPQTIEHLYLVSDPRDKIDLVRRLVRTMKPSSTLLFVNDIERIGELLAKLRFEGFAVDALYGDTPGRERGEVLRKFREGKTKLLVASDVAARGLDVQELALVLQFEPALDADHYVHRAGRTGRMGRSGTSITIVTPKEQFIMDKLGKQLRIEIRERRLAHGRLEGVKGEAKRETKDERSGPRGKGSAGNGADAGSKKAGAGQQAGGAKRLAGAVAAGGKPGAGQTVAGGPKRTIGAVGAKRTGSASAGQAPQAGVASREQAGGRSGERMQAAAAKAGTTKRDASAAGSQKAGKGSGKSAPPARPAAKGKVKQDRERDSKNKGAPRWLKEKRANNVPPNE